MFKKGKWHRPPIKCQDCGVKVENPTKKQHYCKKCRVHRQRAGVVAWHKRRKSLTCGKYGI